MRKHQYANVCTVALASAGYRAGSARLCLSARERGACPSSRLLVARELLPPADLCLPTSSAAAGCLVAQTAAPQPALAVIPPSTTISVPVMKRASSDARNSAALAVSIPSPMNGMGIRACRCFSTSSTLPPVR